MFYKKNQINETVIILPKNYLKLTTVYLLTKSDGTDIDNKGKNQINLSSLHRYYDRQGELWGKIYFHPFSISQLAPFILDTKFDTYLVIIHF